MVVQHNITAMNSNRMLGMTAKTQAKSTEKLSSGYKINRAADDAAGLSISEKMRKQIRGLTQASANAQDGISAVQTAEGALNEVQDMLQRMNELAVKAANGTNSSDDRQYIQNEVDQLVTEIDRVAETTKFNETYLLKGDKSVREKTVKYAADTATASAAGTIAETTKYAGFSLAFAATPADAQAKAVQNDLVSKLSQNNAITVTGSGTASTLGSVSINAEGFDAAIDGTNKKKINISKGGSLVATITVDTIGTDTTTESTKLAITKYATYSGDLTQLYDANGNKIPKNALDDYVKSDKSGYKDGKTMYDAAGNSVTFTAAMFDNTSEKEAGALTLKLHVGADATENNQIQVKVESMSATSIGVKDSTGILKVNGTDDTNALNAIDTIKAAIQKISTQRSALGAIQNRLDHTINNLDNVVENTTNAESQIRDTDMATEMVKYSNNNILAQAGQAMLAQANQSNQGVLSLL